MDIVLIDDLTPETLVTREHVLAAMHGDAARQVSVAQILAKAEITDVAGLAAALSPIAGKLPVYAVGAALPTTDVGPIWHVSYNSIMTRQAFTANGAAYTGYASVNIGRYQTDGQPTPRTGEFKLNGSSYSKTTYAALWNWALHNGRTVALGSWAAGAFVFADNGDGTFKLPDLRGEFPRHWDDGRGVDSGRAFGSSQLDAFQAHFHQTYLQIAGSSTGWANTGSLGLSAAATLAQVREAITDGVNGTPRTAGETRGRNVAVLATLKF